MGYARGPERRERPVHQARLGGQPLAPRRGTDRTPEDELTGSNVGRAAPSQPGDENAPWVQIAERRLEAGQRGRARADRAEEQVAVARETPARQGKAPGEPFGFELDGDQNEEGAPTRVSAWYPNLSVSG